MKKMYVNHQQKRGVDNSKVSNEFLWKPEFHGKKLVLQLIEDYESILNG